MLPKTEGLVDCSKWAKEQIGRTKPLVVGPAKILRSLSVHAYHLALLDEHGHHEVGTRLKCHGLLGTPTGRVALGARRGLGDLQRHRVRNVHACKQTPEEIERKTWK